MRPVSEAELCQVLEDEDCDRPARAAQAIMGICERQGLLVIKGTLRELWELTRVRVDRSVLLAADAARDDD
jgi:hypothetical protein